jgi:hypothetical protein
MRERKAGRTHLLEKRHRLKGSTNPIAQAPVLPFGGVATHPSLRAKRGNPQFLDCITAFAMTNPLSLRGLKGRGNPKLLCLITQFFKNFA